MTLRASDDYVDYRGQTYRELSADRETVVVAVPTASVLPDAVDEGDGRSGPWARLPKSVVGPRWREVVTARWRDVEFRVAIVWEDGATATLHYDGPPAVAEPLGMTGSQYDGWQVNVPVDEIEIVGVEKKVYG